MIIVLWKSKLECLAKYDPLARLANVSTIRTMRYVLVCTWIKDFLQIFIVINFAVNKIEFNDYFKYVFYFNDWEWVKIIWPLIFPIDLNVKL